MKIHIADTAKSTKWKQFDVKWELFVEQRLMTPIVTGETFAVYKSLDKDEKQIYKDCGGYLFGTLMKDSRAKHNVITRNALLLDLDFAPLDVWQTLTSTYGVEMVLHSTHSHESANPRYRLIVPLNRECTPDEYECTARAFAAYLNMQWFDKTTFQRNRLMYFPSISQDGEWVFEWNKAGNFLNVDDVLSSLEDWRDMTTWFYHPDERKHEGTGQKRQDPREAAGTIGAFNRAFDVIQAIETFLTEQYKYEHDDRYTYIKGSSAMGAVVYDGGTWFYSHHATDPAEGRLLNAFELVACHLFNDDIKEASKWANTLGEVRKELILTGFSDLDEEAKSEVLSEQDFNATWYTQLELDKQGKLVASDRNVNLIFANDPNIKGLFRYNDFVKNVYLTRSVSWRQGIPSDGDQIRNTDYPCLRKYLGTKYELTNRAMIEETLLSVAYHDKYNPIQDYLAGLKWDGVPRIETALIDYFAADDNLYTREVFKRSLIGAVMRAFNAGCKHDTALILVGAEGTAKSQFLQRLGMGWHSDTFDMSSGKEVFEQLQGKWIIEIAEFDKLSRQEVGQVKYFITKTSDAYRPAYGHVVEDFPRQCVFFGTTNEDNFLKSETGNRRFYPVRVHNGMYEKGLVKSSKYVFTHMDKYEVDQFWAEAMNCLLMGETNVISKKATLMVDNIRSEYEEQNVTSGEIDMLLDTLVPHDYDNWSIEQCYNFWRVPEARPKGTHLLKEVAPIQIWCELLGRTRESYGRLQQLEMISAIRKSKKLNPVGSTKPTKRYGTQKTYKLKTEE